MSFRWLCFVAALLTCSCTFKKPIVVGSKDGTEQRLLAEIVSQHIEKKLGRTVDRRMELGDTRAAYQALLDGQIGLYPEYSGMIVTEILKDPTVSPDPSVVLERARIELKRIALLEYMEPLGFDSHTTMVVRSAGNENIASGSAAAASGTKWKIGMTPEFQQRQTSIPALTQYPLELGAAFRTERMKDLFQLLQEDKLNMVVTTLTDAHLTSSTWKALDEDKKAFAASQAALLVRDDLLAQESELRGALSQLSGKISLEAMRKMNAAVETDERKVEDVAAEFLKSAGLN